MDEIKIVKHIKEARKRKKLSFQKLAELSGLSPGYLCKIESAKKAPPLATLTKIADALDLDVIDLLKEEGDEFKDVPLAIVRRDERRKVTTKGSFYGYEYEALAYNKPGKNMEIFIIKPAFEEKVFFQHDAEEFMFVLEGVHEFLYGEDRYILKKGDSIYFDARIPHSGRSIGNKKAKILHVIYSYKKIPHLIQDIAKKKKS
jgi:transcriptional regulator with XRE-family HTH domain